jgi:OmpA-OmpF porin, OOP family
VKQYLAQKGIEPDRVRAEGRGENEPVTGDQCKGLRGDKLIACLQPDRRVEVEVRGTREVAATDAPSAGSGATGEPK